MVEVFQRRQYNTVVMPVTAPTLAPSGGYSSSSPPLSLSTSAASAASAGHEGTRPPLGPSKYCPRLEAGPATSLLAGDYGLINVKEPSTPPDRYIPRGWVLGCVQRAPVTMLTASGSMNDPMQVPLQACTMYIQLINHSANALMTVHGINGFDSTRPELPGLHYDKGKNVYILQYKMAKGRKKKWHAVPKEHEMKLVDPQTGTRSGIDPKTAGCVQPMRKGSEDVCAQIVNIGTGPKSSIIIKRRWPSKREDVSALRSYVQGDELVRTGPLAATMLLWSEGGEDGTRWPRMVGHSALLIGELEPGGRVMAPSTLLAFEGLHRCGASSASHECQELKRRVTREHIDRYVSFWPDEGPGPSAPGINPADFWTPLPPDIFTHSEDLESEGHKPDKVVTLPRCGPGGLGPDRDAMLRWWSDYRKREFDGKPEEQQKKYHPLHWSCSTVVLTALKAGIDATERTERAMGVDDLDGIKARILRQAKRRKRGQRITTWDKWPISRTHNTFGTGSAETPAQDHLKGVLTLGISVMNWLYGMPAAITPNLLYLAAKEVRRAVMESPDAPGREPQSPSCAAARRLHALRAHLRTGAGAGGGGVEVDPQLQAAWDEEETAMWERRARFFAELDEKGKLPAATDKKSDADRTRLFESLANDPDWSEEYEQQKRGVQEALSAATSAGAQGPSGQQRMEEAFNATNAAGSPAIEAVPENPSPLRHVDFPDPAAPHVPKHKL